MLLPPLLSELGVEVGEERKIDLVDCQKYLATYAFDAAGGRLAYFGQEREAGKRVHAYYTCFERPFRLERSVRKVYLGSSI